MSPKKPESPFWNSERMHDNLGLSICSREDPRACDCLGLCPCHRGDARQEEAAAAARKTFAERHARDVREGFKDPCRPGTCEHGNCPGSELTS